jgi:hypothetical protein
LGVAPEHAMPTTPQLRGSVCRSTQDMLTRVRPGRHWHMPPTQYSVRKQSLPTMPQLFGSRVRSSVSTFGTTVTSIAQGPKASAL